MPDSRLHVAMVATQMHGHVNPILPIATELVARGHRVTVSVTKEFADMVAETGAEPVVYDSALPSFDGSGKNITLGTLAEGIKLFYDEMRTVVEQTEPWYADQHPDVVLYDVMAWAGPVLAEAWGVRYVQITPSYPGFDSGERAEQWTQEYLGDPVIQQVLADFSAFLAERGSALVATDIQGHPRRGLATIPRAFQPYPELVPDAITFIGPNPADSDAAGQWQVPEDKRVVLVTLGSAYNEHPEFFRTCMAAFAETDLHAVIAVGRTVDIAALGQPPANVEILPWVPQNKILSVAAGFVTHAGMGSAMGALYHQVPTVAVPQGAEQGITAERLDELGLGKHLPMDQVTVESLREAVLSVIDDGQIRARLREMRAQLLVGGGAKGAADILEEEAAAVS